MQHLSSDPPISGYKGLISSKRNMLASLYFIFFKTTFFDFFLQKRSCFLDLPQLKYASFFLKIKKKA